MQEQENLKFEFGYINIRLFPNNCQDVFPNKKYYAKEVVSLLDTSNIKKACRERGYTLKEIEEEAGLKRNSISWWKTCNPGIDGIVKIADVLGCSLDDLVVREKENGKNVHNLRDTV